MLFLLFALIRRLFCGTGLRVVRTLTKHMRIRLLGTERCVDHALGHTANHGLVMPIVRVK